MNTMIATTVIRRFTLTRLFLESVFLVPFLMLALASSASIQAVASSTTKMVDEIAVRVASSMVWLLFNVLLARNVSGWFGVMKGNVHYHIAHIVFSAILLVMYTSAYLLAEVAVISSESVAVYPDPSLAFYFMAIEVLTIATGVHLLRDVTRRTAIPATNWQPLVESKTCLA